MKLFIAVLLGLITFNVANAEIIYLPENPPAEKKTKIAKKKRRAKRSKRKVRKFSKIEKREKSYKLVGIVYLVIGLVFLTFMLTAIVLALVLPNFTIGFIMVAAVSFIGGLVCLIFGLVNTNRNKNWDADYR